MRNVPELTSSWSAFFDVDGTIISIKSMFSFLDYMVHELKIEGAPRVQAYRRRLQRMMAEDCPREEINRYYYSIYQGLDVDLVQRLGRQWYAQVRTQEDLFLPRVLEEIRWHQRHDANIVLVSGSFAAILEPLADELGVDFLIAAPLEVQDGKYSGQLCGPPTIGRGKAEGLLAFAQYHQVQRERCYAYGDDISDIPMLELVGHPAMVNPDQALRSLCQQRSWSIIEAA